MKYLGKNIKKKVTKDEAVLLLVLGLICSTLATLLLILQLKNV